MDKIAYIPGDQATKNQPLSRYLPIIPTGTASSYLAQYAENNKLTAGAWVLDPLGASPGLATEIATQGFRTLVAVNNPVTRFLLEMNARPPSQSILQMALAELAAARKGPERLETHIQSLYLTTCTKCQKEIPAEAFVWERASGALTGRIYRCPCGDRGEYPATEQDRARAANFGTTDSLHRARLLERVAAPGDPDREHAEEALECYLPRAIYALITIINRLDSFRLDANVEKALFALILTTCDESSALWSHPDERPRPKQLTLPPRFLEKNAWMALEQGVETWSGTQNPIQVVNWPETPPDSGGLCLYEGPIRNLAPHIKDLSIAAVVTAFPRPNQAFWTLSALWAGWLWGKEAALPFKAVLRRRRYDWSWHSAALSAALAKFSDHLPLNTPIFGIIPELEPGLLTAVMLAAASTGLELNGLAIRTRHDPAQVVWHRRAFAHAEKEAEEIDSTATMKTIQLALQERGEPAAYLFLHAAGLASMASDHSLHMDTEALGKIHGTIQTTLAQGIFIHHSESTNPESGLWGLQEWKKGSEILPDRVEVGVVRQLQNHIPCTLRDLENLLNTELPGLLTPSLGLIRSVLTSYGIETNGCWELRPEDTAASRRSDLEKAATELTILGEKLGYQVDRVEGPVRRITWVEQEKTIYDFYLLASAIISRLLRQIQGQTSRNFMVIPGGRAGLVAYKLDRDPGLRSIAQNWEMLKFRQLRRLAEMNTLTRDQFENEILSDPIEAPEQMKLF
jgi:hypothetical protein